MNDVAWVVHRLPGRMRLRLPRYRNDSVALTGLAQRLGELPAVLEVRVNAVTGGLLVICEADERISGHVGAVLADLGIEVRTGEPPPTPARPAVRQGLERFDRYLGAASGQATDLRSLGFLFFFALSLLQVARGQVLAPATSLLWYALETLRDPASGE